MASIGLPTSAPRSSIDDLSDDGSLYSLSSISRNREKGKRRLARSRSTSQARSRSASVGGISLPSEQSGSSSSASDNGSRGSRSPSPSTSSHIPEWIRRSKRFQRLVNEQSFLDVVKTLCISEANEGLAKRLVMWGSQNGGMRKLRIGKEERSWRWRKAHEPESSTDDEAEEEPGVAEEGETEATEEEEAEAASSDEPKSAQAVKPAPRRLSSARTDTDELRMEDPTAETFTLWPLAEEDFLGKPMWTIEDELEALYKRTQRLFQPSVPSDDKSESSSDGAQDSATSTFALLEHMLTRLTDIQPRLPKRNGNNPVDLKELSRLAVLHAASDDKAQTAATRAKLTPNRRSREVATEAATSPSIGTPGDTMYQHQIGAGELSSPDRSPDPKRPRLRTLLSPTLEALSFQWHETPPSLPPFANGPNPFASPGSTPSKQTPSRRAISPLRHPQVAIGEAAIPIDPALLGAELPAPTSALQEASPLSRKRKRALPPIASSIAFDASPAGPPDVAPRSPDDVMASANSTSAPGAQVGLSSAEDGDAAVEEGTVVNGEKSEVDRDEAEELWHRDRWDFGLSWVEVVQVARDIGVDEKIIASVVRRLEPMFGPLPDPLPTLDLRLYHVRTSRRKKRTLKGSKFRKSRRVIKSKEFINSEDEEEAMRED